MGKHSPLDDLWRRIDLDVADEQEKIDAAALAGKSRDLRYVMGLKRLLEDEADQVRYYALQSLVLRLQQKDGDIREMCWRLFREDPDEDVRGMAAACLGSIYFGTKSSQAFRRLVDELKKPEQSTRVRSSIYTALFGIVGRPPREWPGLESPWKSFEESDIDWSKVAWLEDQATEP